VEPRRLFHGQLGLGDRATGDLVARLGGCLILHDDHDIRRSRLDVGEVTARHGHVEGGC
jgi:hypothetical protein